MADVGIVRFVPQVVRDVACQPAIRPSGSHTTAGEGARDGERARGEVLSGIANVAGLSCGTLCSGGVAWDAYTGISLRQSEIRRS